MKRLWTAAAVLLLLAGGCLWAQYSVEHGVDAILAEIELADTYAREGRVEEAYKQAVQAEERWTEQEKKLSVFLQHSLLDQLGSNLARLAPALEHGETGQFFIDYESCHVGLIHLRDTNSLNWHSLA